MKRISTACFGFTMIFFFLLFVNTVIAQYTSAYDANGKPKSSAQISYDQNKNKKTSEQQDAENKRNAKYWEDKENKKASTTNDNTNSQNNSTRTNTVSSKVNTAHVYFSTEIPVGGNAKESKEFTISPDGGYVYLVVNNSPDNFNYDELQLKIKKTIGGVDQAFDNKTYTISSNVFSTYIKYSFFSSGNYIFDVYSKYGNLVGSTSVTINVTSSSSSSSSSPSSSSDDCIASSYKQYYNSKLGFSMCIPKDAYGVDEEDNKITVKEFYGKKLTISFISDPEGGIDKFDASIIDMARDILKTTLPTYYRKEFKMLSSKGEITIYRSVISATTSTGSNLQESLFYVKMNGNKIKGKDYMLVSGPLCNPSDDSSYQIIIELGMLSHLKIY